MYLLELWFSLGIHLEVGFLGHMVVLFLVFSENSILFSIVAVLTVQGDSLLSTCSPAFVVHFLMIAILTGVR